MKVLDFINLMKCPLVILQVAVLMSLQSCDQNSTITTKGIAPLAKQEAVSTTSNLALTINIITDVQIALVDAGMGFSLYLV